MSGPCAPDGYHSVASVYLAVSLYEEVAATSTDTGDITVSISPASTLDLDGVDIPLDERNLAYKAAAIMADVSEHSTGVHLEITKRVPVAGGMGGGSADAAATLLACDALWNSGLSREELAPPGRGTRRRRAVLPARRHRRRARAWATNSRRPSSRPRPTGSW